jgi:oligosaccharide repeat unit polymerase
MEFVFLSLFVAACAGLLMWGMLRPERVYEYPFLMGAIFSAFMIPQAITLVNDPRSIAIESINGTLFMGALCMFMAWAGYKRRPLHGILYGEILPLDDGKIALCGFAALIISQLAVFGMSQIPPEEIQAAATGPFTILAFFAGFAVISFPIFLNRALEKHTLKNILFALLAGAPIAGAMIFAGRRGQTVEMVVFVAIILYFKKGITPGRLLVLSFVFATAYLIPVMAAMRGELWSKLSEGNFAEIPFELSMNKILKGDILELRNAAAVIQSTTITGEYGYGTGYWDALVFRYVPGQLVGFDIKNGLQFNWTPDVNKTINYKISFGSTSTAIADTYQQLGYFGCLFFWIQGFFFKNLWVLAARRNSFIAQVAYVALVPAALVAVSHGSVWFLQGGAIVCMVLYAFYRFARLPPQRSRSRQRLRADPRNNSRIMVAEDNRFARRGKQP